MAGRGSAVRSSGACVATNPKVRCLARLIYSMLASSDGYTEDERGRFGWSAPALLEARRVGNGVAVLRYAVRR